MGIHLTHTNDQGIVGDSFGLQPVELPRLIQIYVFKLLWGSKSIIKQFFFR